MIYWLCGQPASGKTTIGKELVAYFQEKNENVLMIDGDNLRDILCNHDYSPSGREKNLESVLNIARFLDAGGFHVVIAVVAPYNKHRQELKRTNQMVEVYLYTDEIRGREHYFVDNFEMPESNALLLNTGNLNVKECVDIILDKEIYA